MQVILLHFGDVNLKNQGKKTNSLVIEELRGIKNYDAHSDQIEAMRSKIKRKNYEEMKKRAQGLSQVETDSGSSNISRFLVYFEVEDIQWIKDIQEACNEKIKE